MAEINYKEVKEGWVDPKKLNLDMYYQRGLEISNVKTIRKNMQMTGKFDQSRPITVNPTWGVVDGGQRVRSAINEGFDKVKYVMYKFETSDDESKYFDIMNIPTKGVSVRDKLFNKYYRQKPDAYTSLVYQICNHKNCLLSGGHDLKMGPGIQLSKDLIRTEQICYIINHLIFRIRSGYTKTNSDELSHKTIEVLALKGRDTNVIYKVNDFLKFFFDSFGWSTQKSDLKFKDAFLRGCLQAYCDVLCNSKLFNKKRNYYISRLRSNFQLDLDATKRHKDQIAEKIIDKMNGKIQKAERRVGSKIDRIIV